VSTTSAGTAEQRFQALRRFGIEKVELQTLDTRKRVHGQEIDRHHAAAAGSRAHALGRDLAPAARRSAEINDLGAWLEQPVLVVDLRELKRCARAQPFALGARHIGIVELALQPAPRGLGAAGGAHPDLEIAFTAAHAVRCSHAPSARISSIKMPSRSPRSATRSRSHGNARRIASRMAQPASTRSARSAPIQGLAARSS